MERLLDRMASIDRMERGKLCQMTGRSHYNHQTWQGGRNVVRYVRADEAASVQKAIDGYRLFMSLAEQYVEEVIRQTRREQARRRSVAPKKDRRPPAPVASSRGRRRS